MAFVWDNGKQPSWREALHNLVRNGSRISRNSLMRKVGAGSSSQLFEAAPPITFHTNSCEHNENEANVQVVEEKEGGAEPAVSERTLSTFCSKKSRKSDGLHLNSSKSEAIAFYNPRSKPLAALAESIGTVLDAGSPNKLQTSIKNLGVYLDSKMSIDKQVTETCKAYFFPQSCATSHSCFSYY